MFTGTAKNILLLIGLLCLGPAMLHAQEKQHPSPATQSPDALSALTYTHKLKLIGKTEFPKEIKEAFQGKSSLALLKKRPLHSYISLAKRASGDQKILQKILFSLGYYDGATTLDITDSKDEKTTKDIVFSVTLGKRYVLKTLKVIFTPLESGPAPCQKTLSDLGLHENKPFTAQEALSVFEKINEDLETCGYPFSKITTHEAVLSKQDKTIDLILTINPGPYIKLGDLQLQKTGAVPGDFITNRSPFKTGDVFDQRKIDKYHEKLSKTKLFDKISIKKSKKAGQTVEGEELPLILDLEEAKPRTIAGGVKFGTSEGIGTKASWIHRNLTGKADQFMATAEQSQKLSLVDLNYQLPDFIKVDQTLGTTLEYKEERTKAYNSRGFGGAITLNNVLDEGWSYSYGLMFESVRLSQYAQIIRVDGIGIPLSFTINTQNDPLDPSSGSKLMINFTPEYGHLGKARFLAKTQIYGSHHFPLNKSHTNVLALWSRLGTIFGATRDNIPGDRRFHSGGGGSIRGYGHQLAGPLNGEGKPLGGKSLLEIGIEPRFKFHDNWGAVVFLEGALVSKSTYPTLKNPFLMGVGAGLRYYTSFGPIRADLAIPLRKRRKEGGKVVDRAFQLYISIGQAF